VDTQKLIAALIDARREQRQKSEEVESAKHAVLAKQKQLRMIGERIEELLGELENGRATHK